jgi:hypothetical protein
LAGLHGAGCSRSVAFVADGLRQNTASKQVLAGRSEIEAAVDTARDGGRPTGRPHRRRVCCARERMASRLLPFFSLPSPRHQRQSHHHGLPHFAFHTNLTHSRPPLSASSPSRHTSTPRRPYANPSIATRSTGPNRPSRPASSSSEQQLADRHLLCDTAKSVSSNASCPPPSTLHRPCLSSLACSYATVTTQPHTNRPSL